MSTKRTSTRQAAPKVAKSSNAKAKAKKASSNKATQKVTLNKELKYIYPKGIFGDTPEHKAKMKAFRGKVRKKIQKLEAAVAKAGKSKKTAARQELISYKQEVLVNPDA